MSKVVLAIDPGTSKCGMALAKRTDTGSINLLWNQIVPVDGVIPKLHEAFAQEPYQLIVIGAGTGHQPVLKRIREHLPGVGTLVVDERDTTLEARERYWEYNPRRGWRRFVPSTLQIPPNPVDDYVALILAERVLLGE